LRRRFMVLYNWRAVVHMDLDVKRRRL
jgi:hypothetical protein